MTASPASTNTPTAVRRILTMGLIVMAALGLLLAAAGSASAAPSSSDAGYIRLELDSTRQPVVVGKIPKSVFAAMNATYDGTRGSAIAGCSAFVGSKLPLAKIKLPSSVGGLAGYWFFDPLCARVVDKVWQYNRNREAPLCFRVPLTNYGGTKVGYCS
ncbi:hypothetical protein [Rhodococcus sp. NBC_00297]|uniref:hypothetical protein n=1 Tax=Rhodococcus sp. NBC_00297 TaxID=2976005 RepID=UPI002E2C51A3|nr:hypothetical protein [Rhodococcus sp. NBC_00297]